MTIYDHYGVSTVINARGPSTRLSGGIMCPEVSAAMAEASRHCVDMAELQAAASQRIAAVTGAEAGYVASGAAACLLLAAAACITGLDLAAMARLPDTAGLRNEVVMVRSQRNFYDHAVRTAGVRIVEVGLPDRYAGAGVRDAEGWEIEAAISDRTAAVFYVADAQARPPLAEIVRVANAAGVPVIVDAAARLPPQSNLRHFIAEGAGLVAFSGGKAIGGPQASGFLCGRRDLVMAAALQHLDFDVFWEMWEPPAALIDKGRLRGVPQHGIGRPCKAGKEEIAGLLTALDLFVAEGDAARHSRWLETLELLNAALGGLPANIEGGAETSSVPQLILACADPMQLILNLQRSRPSIHADPARTHRGEVVLNPMCLRPGEAEIVGKRIAELLAAA